MSGFRDLIQALRKPLEFSRDHPDRAERVVNAKAAVQQSLERGRSLDLPPDVLRRFAALEASIEEQALGPETARQALEQLGPVLEPGYPSRALGLSPERLPGVGPKTVQALYRREIACIEDLLFFLPRGYEDRRELVAIEDLQVGQPACFTATVTRAGVVLMRNGRRFLQVVVSDGTAAVTLKWFRGIPHFQDRLKSGRRLIVAGEVRRYRYSKELHHPEVDVLSEKEEDDALARIVPLYSVVEGVPPRTLRRIVEAAVGHAADLVDAYLPEALAAKLGLPGVNEALRQVHLPGTHLDPEELRARRTPYHLRLVAEELFLLQAGLIVRRAKRRSLPGEPLQPSADIVGKALSSLPFELTRDQTQAWAEIASDLSLARPMNRLLIGDVGTGKTVLAQLAAAAAHAANGVTAVLAPTEILAEQHEATFRRLLTPLGINVSLLTGQTPAAERARLARRLDAGSVSVVVGTHALLTESVALPRLKLIVIDEQHRFGVAQRQLLEQKGRRPHVLSMSATPIPRTLSLTLFGDLDHTELRERPASRPPVETHVFPESRARAAFDAVRETLARGEQVYVVYPLVEESEKQDLRNATRGFERMQKALPGVKIGLLHGKLDPEERSRTMRAFAAGSIHLLVATTVIEVGVDVAGATLLVVQHAERFGLAQLHQLRGRVGRGSQPGRAILIADAVSKDASRRLDVLEQSSCGFDIADADLQIRGAGEWLGTRQAGHLPELRLADLVRHRDFLPELRAAAEGLVEGDPTLAQHAELRAAIERRWGRRLDLGFVA